MIEDCRKVGLKDPVINDSSTEFVITIWRPDKKCRSLENQEKQVANWSNQCNCNKDLFIKGLHDLRSKIKGSLVIMGNIDESNI